jgi:hypothetical protein
MERMDDIPDIRHQLSQLAQLLMMDNALPPVNSIQSFPGIFCFSIFFVNGVKITILAQKSSKTTNFGHNLSHYVTLWTPFCHLCIYVCSFIESMFLKILSNKDKNLSENPKLISDFQHYD